MKKKRIILIIVFMIIVLIIGGILLLLNQEYPFDENTLYSITFGKTMLRFERYDYSLGQNQIVGVEKTTNKGKNYEKLTTEPIVVSMEAKFVFINEKVGFAISKPNLTKTNNYMGVKVTQDGGKTFTDGIINYSNPNIEILTIEDVPYQENNLLKLPCSIYQVKEDQSGYEDIKLIFISTDNGLTWNLRNETKDVSLTVKKDTVTVKEAVFTLKNNTDKEYLYGPDYVIEKKENGKWKELETITGEPLIWNAIAYTLKGKEEKELMIDWSYGYGELKSGKYRLLKSTFKEEDRPIDESKIFYLYAEFEIQ